MNKLIQSGIIFVAFLTMIQLPHVMAQQTQSGSCTFKRSDYVVGFGEFVNSTTPTPIPGAVLNIEITSRSCLRIIFSAEVLGGLNAAALLNVSVYDSHSNDPVDVYPSGVIFEDPIQLGAHAQRVAVFSVPHLGPGTYTVQVFLSSSGSNTEVWIGQYHMSADYNR